MIARSSAHIRYARRRATIRKPPGGNAGGFSISKSRTAILIDGGHLRERARKAGLWYSNDLIEQVARACVADDETLLRILYYDCAPFEGTAKLPISGEEHVFRGSDAWMNQLASRELFAVRRGVLKFRGFKPKNVPINPRDLRDSDFTPDFEQKGVDMRIGLDMASFSEQRSVDRLTLISGDTDCVPAMKHARKAGLQMTIVKFPDCALPTELKWHADFIRSVAWPIGLTTAAEHRAALAAKAAEAESAERRK